MLSVYLIIEASTTCVVIKTCTGDVSTYLNTIRRFSTYLYTKTSELEETHSKLRLRAARIAKATREAEMTNACLTQNQRKEQERIVDDHNNDQILSAEKHLESERQLNDNLTPTATAGKRNR